MSLLRQPLDLEREHHPFQAQPALEERLGLGPPRPRKPICNGFTQRWSTTYSIALTIAAASAEVVSGHWIQQPFLLRRVRAIPSLAFSSGQYWGLALSSVDPTVTITTAGHFPVLWRAFSEGSDWQWLSDSPKDVVLEPNLVIRNVPTKFQLFGFNTSGGAVTYQALIDLTFLTPNDITD